MTRRDDLDPDMQAFLRAFDQRTTCEPNPEIVALLADDQPADLRALLDAYARHHGGMAVRDHMFEAFSCDRLTSVVESLDPDGVARKGEGVERLDLARAIVVGQTGDGEVFHAAAWADGDDRMTIVTFCMAGYANDGYRLSGGFIETLRGLAEDADDPEDVDEPIRELLGVSE